jgi:hypothetical protein
MLFDMRKSITLLLLMLGLGMGASAVKGQLMITEIMYNSPMDTTNPFAIDSLEYIELYNYSTTPINLNNYNFTSGVTHTFAGNIIVNPGDFVIVSKNSNGYASAFGQPFTCPVDDWFLGSLDDAGELIELRDGQGNLVDSVRYSPNGPWPTQGANSGYSITLCDLTTDNGLGTNWIASNTMVPGLIVRGRQIYANPEECCGSNDNTPPMILSSTVVDPTHLALAFNEIVSMPSTWTANFVGSPSVQTAVRSTSGDSILLTLSTPLQNGDYVTYQVSNIEDLACNQMANDSFTVVINNAIPDFAISEILYDDPSSNDDLEFFEIRNNALSPFAMGGIEIRGDVSFRFPEFVIGASQRVVVAKDRSVILSTFGPLDAFQWTSGSLGNTSGHLELWNSSALQDSLTYFNTPFWPTQANGTGHSIVMCNEFAVQWNGTSWSLSSQGDFTSIYLGDSIFSTPWRENCRTVGVEDQTLTHLQVLPNPVGDKLEIRSQDIEDAEVKIYDGLGREVTRGVLQSGQAHFDMSKYPNGIYFVHLKGGAIQSSKMAKIVKQ